MNVEIETETPIFLFWEYLFRNFGILLCSVAYISSTVGYTSSELGYVYTFHTHSATAHSQSPH